MLMIVDRTPETDARPANRIPMAVPARGRRHEGPPGDPRPSALVPGGHRPRAGGGSMRRRCALTVLVVLLLTVPLLAVAIDRAELSFERAGLDTPLAGWGGGPPGTIARDTTVAVAGRASGRIHRTGSSPQQFSSITRSFPATVGGDTITLRGFIRTDGVTGYAGFWLRQDGDGAPVGFAHMQDREIGGTTAWAEHAISSPLSEDARTIVLGALLAGEGTAWFDSLQVLIDGRPIDEAPVREIETTVLDSDTEFDAGSGIDLVALTPAQIEHTALLGRVWGFVKYHHPDVTRGQWHWDYELFRVLPAVLAAGDRAACQRAIVDWLVRVGLPGPCDPCPEVVGDLHLEPPVDWIEDEALLGTELSRYLATVYERRTPGWEQFYVSLSPQVGNPTFHHESARPAGTLPDTGYRILAVLRYWNIIQYWFPYRDLIDDDWTGVLPEVLPRIVLAHDLDAYRLEMLALIARVRDTHANLYQAFDVRPPRGEAFWPVSLRMIEGHPVVVGYADGEGAHECGLEIGDAVLAVDGRPFTELVERWEPYYCASNRPTMLRDMARWLSRGPVGPGEAEILRDGQRRTVTVARVEAAAPTIAAHDRPGDTFQLLSPDVAYVKLSSVAIDEVPSYIERAEGTRGMVVDIRNYPSEFMVFSLAPRFIDEPTPFARFTGSDHANPGAFLFTPPRTLPVARPGYPGKVAILVDERSISSSEYTAMAMRCGPRAVVVGSTTAGADGNVSRITLPGGLQTMISGIGVFYPDRTPTQRVGIVPDIEARPTIAGIVAGRDEVLEAAVRHILGEGADEATIRRMCVRPHPEE
ncbi:hypothetical protein GF314_10310 [bacterium]|nr:hypothetical protein [bacterium]